MIWLVVVCLLLAAVVLGWPQPGRRARLRRLVGQDSAARQWPTWLVTWWQPAPDRPGDPGRLAAPGSVGRLTAPGGRGRGRLASSPTAGLAVLAGLAAGVCGLLGGPVALVVVAAYAAVAVRAVAVRRRRRSVAARRADLLDWLGIAAADLRAGLPASSALAGVVAARGDDRLATRAGAAVRLAEQTGAPLAALIERIEADARSADRATAAAAAQVAGARATAWLLTGLPLAGLGLGYAIGTEPLPVLLHSPLGAAAAIAAVILQIGGLAWVGRITRVPAVAS